MEKIERNILEQILEYIQWDKNTPEASICKGSKDNKRTETTNRFVRVQARRLI